MKAYAWFVGLLLFLGSDLCAQDSPVELGAVNWLRDYTAAMKQARQQDKPVFLLFQEVPGCLTCRNYGSQVLSHPLLVEAIETYFVPLAIFNNVGGKDRKTLNLFGEPTWNNPVVRLVDAEGKDIVSRHHGDYTALGLVNAVLLAMGKQGIAIPNYLNLLQEELQMATNGLELTTFSMFCFWTGEKVYGQHHGVAHTEAGFMDDREVVRVWFDPSATTLDELIIAGKKGNSADAMYSASSSAHADIDVRKESNFRRDHEVHYYLRNSPYRSVPMSKLQRTRINSMLGKGKDPKELLSPRQRSFRDQPGNQLNYDSEDWMKILLSQHN